MVKQALNKRPICIQSCRILSNFFEIKSDIFVLKDIFVYYTVLTRHWEAGAREESVLARARPVSRDNRKN